MDTFDLSEETYYGILIEAEKLTHDLTLRYGLFSNRCKHEIEFVENAEKLTKYIMQMENWDLEEFFLEILQIRKY